MTRGRHKGIFVRLLDLSQQTLGSWTSKLEQAIQLKKEIQSNYPEIQAKVMNLLRKAVDADMSSREIAEITGVSHGTICRWINLLEGAKSGKETQSLATQ